jgi:diketogulonate reductase-like aldo/keto reductase
MDTTEKLDDSVCIPGTQTMMPRIGFGVYQIASGACQDACATALDLGYRHIDCAQLYRSEAAVGAAVQQSSIQRADVFLTTKVSRPAGSSELTYQNLVHSVEAMGGPEGYVDLFLIHVARFGMEQRRLLWLALERLYDEGKTRAIGVSNFAIDHLEELKEYARVWPPHVNQIEVRRLWTVLYFIFHSPANKVSSIPGVSRENS